MTSSDGGVYGPSPDALLVRYRRLFTSGHSCPRYSAGIDAPRIRRSTLRNAKELIQGSEKKPAETTSREMREDFINLVVSRTQPSTLEWGQVAVGGSPNTLDMLLVHTGNPGEDGDDSRNRTSEMMKVLQDIRKRGEKTIVYSAFTKRPANIFKLVVEHTFEELVLQGQKLLFAREALRANKLKGLRLTQEEAVVRRQGH
ncbi:hypothetical protein HGRIS_001418 [Hohenbuehelia grisea]|uniref:Uncharacterized protein n=1 Tax=Hohenbuehelia grisea TaxID=104357 RepID=A0ABR3JQ21_9AGAR